MFVKEEEESMGRMSTEILGEGMLEEFLDKFNA